MKVSRLFAAAFFGATLLDFSGTSAQQSTSPTPVLTALDYLEIEQLVYRYGYALDTGADNGFAYADLYRQMRRSPERIWRRAAGRTRGAIDSRRSRAAANEGPTSSVTT